MKLGQDTVIVGGRVTRPCRYCERLALSRPDPVRLAVSMAVSIMKATTRG